MRSETPLEKRQRMAETAAYEPVGYSEEWSLDGASTLWAEPAHDGLSVLLRRLVDDLPDRQRAAVELRIWGRHTFDEIADIEGWSSRGEAHMYFSRGLKKLEEALTDGR